jgi:hypothetical protein
MKKEMDKRPTHELASVIDHFLPAFNAKNKLPAHKLKVLDALQKCRTPYMGGHVEACEGCGQVRNAFNSCRNRHCPKCGAIDKEKWVMAREADLLPVKYFHVVFTVPDKLNRLFLENQQAMYDLLFWAVWDTLSDFGSTKKWIGGKIGATAILHTSGQNVNYHPHIHLIVPAGALMPNGKWKHSRNRGKYLFRVESLSEVFRARFVKKAKELISNGTINGTMPKGLFLNDWVVYAKQPFGGPKQVINYLSRYTHRTAISNNRIIKVDDKEVTFIWKDYRNDNKQQVTTLDGQSFLALFCLHILPPKYTRIRHFGFLSSASKRKSLALIRASLNVNPAPQYKPNQKWQEIVAQRMGITPGVCKCCGGRMVIIEILPNHFRIRQRPPPEKNTFILSTCETFC